MRMLARSTLRDFWEHHADSEDPLKAWFKEAEKADWAGPQDIEMVYHSASILKDSRVCFNIGGNKYRLIVKFIYEFRIGYIRFIGTHDEYDKIDAN